MTITMTITKTSESHLKQANLREQMLDFLRHERIPINGKLPPLRELSRRFNVSVAMIRKTVLNLEKSGELSVKHGSGVYVVDKDELVMETTILRPVRGNKTVCIIDAFAKGDMEGHYLDNFVISELIQGAKDACQQAHWGLKILSFVIGEGEQAILHKIAQNKDDLVLMVANQHFLPLLDEVEKLNVPAVVLGPLGNQPYRFEVSIDLFEAGLLAGTHLAEKGHEKVLYVGQVPTVGKISYLRYAGFCYAHRKAFPAGTIHEVFLPDATSSAEIREVFLGGAAKALEYIDSVSAVFISSEQIALVLVPYLLQNGVRIPQTVSLITIDNSRFGELFTPRWTSVDLNRPGAAQAAFEMLAAGEKAALTQPFFRQVVPSRLVVRESVVVKETGEKSLS